MGPAAAPGFRKVLMPDDPIAKQVGFLAHPGADVVEDERCVGGRIPAADDADGQDAAAQAPRDPVAGR